MCAQAGTRPVHHHGTHVDAADVTFEQLGVQRWDDVSVSVVFGEIPDYFRNLEIIPEPVN